MPREDEVPETPKEMKHRDALVFFMKKRAPPVDNAEILDDDFGAKFCEDEWG
jgi:hypothetical protein